MLSFIFDIICDQIFKKLLKIAETLRFKKLCCQMTFLNKIKNKKCNKYKII